MTKKRLLISIHDVTPKYASEIILIKNALEKRHISSYSLLVTPNWNDTHHLNDAPGFLSWLKAEEKRGAELILHGYNHQEHLMNEQQLKRYLHLGGKTFSRLFGHSSKGYIPPCWHLPKHARLLVEKEGFLFTEDLFSIRIFGKKKISGLPLGMESYSKDAHFNRDWISPLFAKWYSRIYARYCWLGTHTVRFSLHPREIHNGNFSSALKLLDQFLKRGYKPINYHTILQQKEKEKKN